MSNDYFSDLAPPKPASDDANLLGGMSEQSPIRAMSAQPSIAAPDNKLQGLDGEAAAGLGLPSLTKDDSRSADEQSSGFVPMGEGRAKREARELQEFMEKMFCRFGSDIKSAMDAQSRQLESLEDRVTALTSSLADTRAEANASTTAAAHQSAAVGEALRDVLSGLQLVRDRQELSISHLELAKASVASARPSLTPAVLDAEMPAHMSSVAMATPEASAAQAPVSQHGMLELPTAPASVAVRASPSASAPPAPPAPSPAAHVALVQPEQALSANSTQFVPSNQQQLPQAQSQPAIQPQPQQMQQLPDYLQRQVPGESPIAQPAGAAPGNLSRHQQPQQQQQQQQPQQQAFVPAQPQSQQQQIPAYQLQQPAYAPSPRSSNGSFVPPPKPFAVQARPSSPPQAQYGVPPQQQQQQHTVSSAAPPYAPPASYAPHPHMQQQMYQQHQQQASQPQFAAQPPLPPRMVPQAPPQGLWRGPQPEPFRSPSQRPEEYGDGTAPPSRGTSSQGRGRKRDGGGGRGDGRGDGGSPPQARDIPLESVIDEVALMGFSRHEVRDAVMDLMDSGKAVDLNVVLDSLMNR